MTLRVDGLVKRFGSVIALNGVSFEVHPGELFGFVGSNGAGKTTTMRIILGVLAADAGEVSLDGRPLDLRARSRIGYMPEERGLYPKMKAREHLVYLGRLHGQTHAQAVDSADRWLTRLGLIERAGDEIQKLSLGNQQRVQLAAALVHNPELLVLDEPFSGLDPVAVDVLSGVLREAAAAGVPVIFSSHQLELVERLCDRVGIIRAGQMVATGSVGELTGGGPKVIEVETPDAEPGWAQDLAGVRLVSATSSSALFELAPGADDQQFLRAALDTGRVSSFAPRRPTLTELFRNVVTTPGDQEKADV